MKRLAVIDGKSIFYRGYYAMPNLSLPDGTPTGGVYGFASIAIELIKKLEPDYVAVAWDKPKTNIRKRREIYPAYKAGRKPAPADFYAQIPLLMELLDAFGWPFYELDDYEADDIMGAFAKQATEKGIETYLLTSDLDALQLVSETTKVYAIKNGLSNLEEFDIAAFETKYGIDVEQFLDLKSLKGDASDNIPGVPGVGEKTAIQLLQDFKTLDGVYEHLDDVKPTLAKKLTEGKESAYMSKEIGRIWTDAPIALDWDVASIDDIDLPRIAQILERLEFHSLTKRLPKYMQIVAADVPKEALPALTKKEWSDTLSIDGPVFVEIHDETLWLSLDAKSAIAKPLHEVDAVLLRSLEWAKVVSYDVKALYHLFAAKKLFPRFQTVHDLRQGAFLIDPLTRDRSLAGLVGAETSEMTEILAALRSVYAAQEEAFNAMPSVATVATELDFPLTYNLFRMEYRGVKIDPKKLQLLSDALGEEHRQLEQEMYAMAGYEFNIASPAQLAEVLFTKLQLSTQGIKKGKTGYSTGQSELDKLRGQHPIIELIEKTRELAKLKNTYTDSLPKLADESHRIHSTFNQDVAATGRLSSTNPNLQNIPIRTEQGRRIREAFIADKGNVLVSADYSQFELRLAAVLANDTSLIEDFSDNTVDIHTKTASEVYGIALADVTKDQRRAAKVINFGVMYGMSPHGLAANTGMSFTQAKTFIDQYFELRAPIRQFIDATLEKARTEGYVETYYGRRRPTPDVKSSNYMVRSGAERAAANMPIQGTEADLMKRAMLRIDEKIGGLGEQILQIHDSILVECPKQNSEKIATILKEVMESIAPELAIPLKVDVSIGKSWGEM